MRFRLVSWNLQRSRARMADQVEHLLDLAPDAALLQESFSLRALLPDGYFWHRSATGGGWGCAVLLGPRLQQPIAAANPKPHRPGRTARVDAVLEGVPLSFVSVHPQATKSKTASGSSSAKWVRDLDEQLLGHAAIVGGDWNVGPGVGDHLGFSKALSATGWVGCAGSVLRGPTHRHNSGSLWAIDHIFTRGLASTSTTPFLDRTTELSDHWPLVVDWPHDLPVSEVVRRP